MSNVEYSSTLMQKALLDPWYAPMVLRGASAAQLLDAGFFDDTLEQPARQYDWFDAPVCPEQKWHLWCTQVQQAVRQIQGEHQAVVLLSTGAFSPVHQGHLQMMVQAKVLCSQREQTVVGCVLSAGHDQYVGQKYGGSAFYPSAQRLKWLQQAVDQAPKSMGWLVAHWEAVSAPVSVNFTDVIAQLQRALQKEGIDVTVVYVFGSDNAGFRVAFAHENDCVCVVRTAISSSMVRAGHMQALPVGVDFKLRSAPMQGKDGVL